MAGYTDSAFRRLTKPYGVGLAATEFVSAEALVRHSVKTTDYLIFNETERPIAIQIFGSQPEVMADAARIVEQRFKPDIIDLNLGCSVKKVIKKGAGAALLKDPNRIGEIARHVTAAVRCPVTAKIRSGWNSTSIVAVEVAQILAQSGVRAITVHPRTAAGGFKCPADYRIIARVKSAVSIPIIGNGDIFQPQDALRMWVETGCDGIMIGRGSLGNPWLFQSVREVLQGRSPSFYASPSDRLKLCLEHIRLAIEVYGENNAVRSLRKFYRWYLRGLPRAADIRSRTIQAPQLAEVIALLERCLAELTGSGG